ncbi:MAG: DUF983 domain-containing protein [Alphaproteobacteria bacterium]
MLRILMRAIRRRCPNCGVGRLFMGYLKPVAQCAACGEGYGHIRADDGPAWLTILIVGHILAPLLLTVEERAPWPEWYSMLVWPAIAFALMLVILPRAKGAFIAVLWRTRAPGSEGQ